LTVGRIIRPAGSDMTTAFLSKMHLPRRTVLKALGAIVGLPLLDAMIPAGTAIADTAAAAKPRMTFVYFPHGAVPEGWTPKRVGAHFDLPPILAPLAPFQKQLTVISGTENKSAVATPVHAITPATWLSCVPPRTGHYPYGGITVDQVAARKLGQDTRLPSIQVATEEEGGEGFCDRRYGSGYARTLSFSTPSTPLPMETNPRRLFQQLFGGGDCAVSNAAGRSVVDLVRHDATALSRALGRRDRAMLDDYLTSVREVEHRVQKHSPSAISSVPLGYASHSEPPRFDERMRLMFDLIALAYQANVTRVATYMMAAEVSEQRYPFLGIDDSFHALSHHQNSPARLERLTRIQTLHSELFAKFVEQLARMPDGEGSMLDHSLILYGSNMSDGNLHDHFPLPLAVVGGGCGKLLGNQHLRCADRTPIANLHVALLNRADIPTGSFGDNTGELAGI
jgi:hypothetical protein